MDPFSWIQKLLIVCQPFQTGTKPYKIMLCVQGWVHLFTQACLLLQKHICHIFNCISVHSQMAPHLGTNGGWYWITIKSFFVSLLISKLDCAVTTVEGKYCSVKNLNSLCFFFSMSCIIFLFTSSRILKSKWNESSKWNLRHDRVWSYVQLALFDECFTRIPVIGITWPLCSVKVTRREELWK